MKLNISNEFPLNADINLKFYNSSNNLIQDSLYSDLVYAAEIDDNGRTIEPNLYSKDINLDSNQIDAFFNSDNVIIDIEMNTSNTENSSVKLYTDYEIIFSNLAKHLNSNGIALIEIGYNQLERVSDLARLSNLHVYNVFKDLQGFPRCMILCHPNSTVL